MYFNFAERSADDWWSRRAFVRAWWRGNARDRRWVPPNYPFVVNTVVNRAEPYFNSLHAAALTLEAVPRRDPGSSIYAAGLAPGMGDTIVAQGLVLTPNRRDPVTAYLAMLSVSNDEESLEHLLAAAWQQGMGLGAQRLVAPAELAPSFSAGLLMDHFHRPPPLHTPYNSPYLPELLEGAMDPVRFSRLWHLETTTGVALPAQPAGIEIAAFDVRRLAADLLPLLHVSACDAEGSETPPDPAEVEFALRMWSVSPLIGCLAQIDGAPVGFVLMQADVGAAMRSARGGLPLWGRAALAFRPPVRATAGRLLLGALLPEQRGRGLALHLLGHALAMAREFGWRTLATGPVAEGSAAAHFLESIGAIPLQRYCLFAQEG